MAKRPHDQLVVAISSRALFDFEEENLLFEKGDDHAYMARQLDLLDGVMITNARAVGEFGAVSVVSGATLNQTMTLPLLVEQLNNDYKTAAAFTAAAILALMAVLSPMVCGQPVVPSSVARHQRVVPPTRRLLSSRGSLWISCGGRFV